MFIKGSNQQPTKAKQGSRTRPAKKAEGKNTEKQDEPLNEKEKIGIMVQWAVNGFKPSGPEGFAPSEGKSHTLELTK